MWSAHDTPCVPEGLPILIAFRPALPAPKGEGLPAPSQWPGGPGLYAHMRTGDGCRTAATKDHGARRQELPRLPVGGNVKESIDHAAT